MTHALRHLRRLAPGLAGRSSAAPAMAQSPPAAALGLGVSLQVPSKALGTPRSILVSVPDQYATSTSACPTLILLDAEDQFRSAVATVRFLASRALIPDMVVVGVVNDADRTHDLAPPATGETATEYPTAGGADSFLSFLVGDLLPWVDRHYRTSSLRVLAGHSFGGLFALHAAIREPSPFRIVVAMSPSLWWNDGNAVDFYAERLLQLAAPLSLFVTSGSLEPVIDQPTSRLMALLDSAPHPSLAVTYRRYPEVGHRLTPFYSLADGLRSSFQSLAVPLDAAYAALTTPAPADPTAFADALATLEAQYSVAARDLDCPSEFPEAALNFFAYITLDVHPRQAVSFFRTNTVRYPESANAFDSLGDGLLAVHDTASARLAFEMAVALATKHHDPVGDRSRARLAALAARH